MNKYLLCAVSLAAGVSFAKDSGTTFARDALQKYLDSGEIPGAITVFHDVVAKAAERFFHLEGSYRHGFKTRVARSRDLKSWEFSPHVVLDYTPEDKMLYPTPPAEFTDAEKAYIAGAKDVNASDLDMCEWNGKLVCFYSWGNQRGNEFSALAEADCTEREFCESFFD